MAFFEIVPHDLFSFSLTSDAQIFIVLPFRFKFPYLNDTFLDVTFNMHWPVTKNISVNVFLDAFSNVSHLRGLPLQLHCCFTCRYFRFYQASQLSALLVLHLPKHAPLLLASWSLWIFMRTHASSKPRKTLYLKNVTLTPLKILLREQRNAHLRSRFFFIGSANVE